ncbi:lipase chaperone [Vibrio sp. ZSDZ65]|uniref:Lipase chaperone n=1 Tax=Vibrio qingdaonensis TaxID=2829491 RepID=A0A9X3HX68_9VIBR|nr:lipase secretion chaperone [Vibrio qingdaonensis]MCW8346943.1 lipase chaperone [Vibrio qingdaonensis]
MRRLLEVKVLIAVISVVTMAIAAWSTLTDAPASLLQAPSQRGTVIDHASERDTFEYFISALDQENKTIITQRFERYNQQLPNSEQLEFELFEKYMRYKAALANLERSGESTTDLHALHEQMLLIQKQFFTDTEQERLFGEENLLRQLALTKKVIQASAQSGEEFQQRWQSELEQLSPKLQKSFYNASVLTALNDTNSMEEQNQFIAREALVGSEATQRLVILDEKRAAFDRQVQSYLVARADILNNESFDENERQLEIQALRKPLFDSNQLRRIEALERIHDQQTGGNDN